LAPFRPSEYLASLPESSEGHDKLHEAGRFRRDDRELLPVPLLPQVEPILVDAAEIPLRDHLGRPLDANPLADEKERLPGAELRRDVEKGEAA